MSDVSARCAHCGTEIFVSEFVDPGSLKCPSCGQPLILAKPAQQRKAPSVLRRKDTTAGGETTGGGTAGGQTAGPETAGTATGGTRSRRPVFRAKRRSVLVRLGKLQISDYWLSWVIFVVFGPALGYLRWGNVITDPLTFGDVKFYGQIALLIFYAVVIVEALREEFFDGLVAFFVPPYALYYLFFKSDSFFLRAMIAVLAIGFGYDICVVIFDLSMRFYDWGMYELHGGALE